MVTLNESAFYPTSGGQPHDTGLIAGIPVLDVYEDGGEIIHVIDSKDGVSGDVDCEVSWTRRHDHMQQHTGQHILSQAIVQTANASTEWFAIGPDWSTIVLNTKLTLEQLDQSLELANSVVDEDRTIDVLFPSTGELEKMPIRGSIPTKERVRIVRIEEFDWSPCGGTHCSTTGDVRLVAVLGTRWEKGQFRIEFVCGKRAEAFALQSAKTVAETAALLDVGRSEVVERTKSLLAKLRDCEQKISDMQEARIAHDANTLLADTGNMPSGIVAKVLENYTVHDLRRLAHMVIEKSGTIALLVGSEKNKIGLVFARSEDRDEDMNQIQLRRP